MESWLQDAGDCLGGISRLMSVRKSLCVENSWRKLAGAPSISIHGLNIRNLNAWFMCSQEISLSPSTSCNSLKVKTWVWLALTRSVVDGSGASDFKLSAHWHQCFVKSYQNCTNWFKQIEKAAPTPAPASPARSRRAGRIAHESSLELGTQLGLKRGADQRVFRNGCKQGVHQVNDQHEKSLSRIERSVVSTSTRCSTRSRIIE